MNGFIILIVLLFLGGIILLSGKSFNKKKTREQFLKELAEFLEGTLEPIKDESYENSFRIRFKYANENFIYEDLKKPGFKENVNAACLKIEVPGKLLLKFEEKKHSAQIRRDIFIASDVSAQSERKNYKIQMPKQLEDLSVFTSDPVVANRIFEDKKISNIFKAFKNTDTLGHPFLSIGVINGVMTLEFYPGDIYYPNLTALYADVSSIDHHLSKLMVIVRKLKKQPS